MFLDKYYERYDLSNDMSDRYSANLFISKLLFDQKRHLEIVQSPTGIEDRNLKFSWSRQNRIRCVLRQI